MSAPMRFLEKQRSSSALSVVYKPRQVAPRPPSNRNSLKARSKSFPALGLANAAADCFCKTCGAEGRSTAPAVRCEGVIYVGDDIEPVPCVVRFCASCVQTQMHRCANADCARALCISCAKVCPQCSTVLCFDCMEDEVWERCAACRNDVCYETCSRRCIVCSKQFCLGCVFTNTVIDSASNKKLHINSCVACRANLLPKTLSQ